MEAVGGVYFLPFVRLSDQSGWRRHWVWASLGCRASSLCAVSRALKVQTKLPASCVAMGVSPGAFVRTSGLLQR